MQTHETDAAVIPFRTTEETAPAAKSNYGTVRFNAMRHGILSRYTVLSYEDADEYRALLSALVEEHQLASATEAHLVEELATIIWRKRRVLQTEGAAINRGLLSVATQRHDRPLDPPGPAQAAVPFEPYNEGIDAAASGGTSGGHASHSRRGGRATTGTQHDLQGTERAAAILRKGAAMVWTPPTSER